MCNHTLPGGGRARLLRPRAPALARPLQERHRCDERADAERLGAVGARAAGAYTRPHFSSS
jgi:hypothetical protein